MSAITAANIMSHIAQKKAELEKLEKLNEQLMA